jgi:1-acyl-sn-glycerol-3-phosphate acyltransferase
MVSVKPFFRVRSEGIENVPRSGPFILAANHVSYVDPLVLAITCPRPIRFIMLREFWEKPFIGWVCRKAGSFPVDPLGPTTAALRSAMTVLHGGKVLGIFPEGGRSPDGRLLPGKAGVALLVLKTGLPLVPAAILGADRAYSRKMLLPRPYRITVRYGAPLTFPPPPPEKKRDFLAQTTEVTMRAIAALHASAEQSQELPPPAAPVYTWKKEDM